MGETAKVLSKAANKLERSKWTRGWSALDKNGCYCVPSSKRAVQFCMSGAVRAVAPNSLSGNVALDYLSDFLGEAPTGWNDNVAKSKRQVVSALRRAAKAVSQ